MRNRDLSFLLKVGLAVCIGMILQMSLQAQNFSTRTYDTLLTGNGFGMYNVNFPQFSPDSGQLVSVKVSATVTSNYGFTLRNADNNPATYSLTLGQEDLISGSGIASTYTNVVMPFTNSYSLAPGDSVKNAPFAFLNGHVSADSITGNVAAFLGSGQVSFNYMSFTFTNLNTVNNSTYYYSANIANSMHFTVQYLYLTSNVALATDLTRFSAELSQPRTTQLAWAAVNETAGRSYDIQRSIDSKSFVTVGSMPASGNGQTADYNYADNLPDSSGGNIYYRLQVHDQGNLSYSQVRQVNVAKTASGSTTATATAPVMKIYPNPATSYINLVTGATPDDWQVDILATNGALVLRQTFLQSTTLNVNFANKLASGTYFVRLTSLHTGKRYSSSFVVALGAN